MTTLIDYLDYAELAQAVYADEISIAGLKDKDFRDEQTKYFLERYKVKATTQGLGIGQASGLDATLFYDTYNSQYVLAIRGTEPYACTHASHLATPRIRTWPADASTLGHLAHPLFGQPSECDARLS
jgi:hypothetical protein